MRLDVGDVARIVVWQPGWAYPWTMVNACAIAFAESAGDPHAVHVVDDPGSPAFLSLDLGLWQINTRWHPEVGTVGSLDPVQAVGHVWRISSAGRSWQSWTTFVSGAHSKFVPSARVALRALGVVGV